MLLELKMNSFTVIQFEHSAGYLDHIWIVYCASLEIAFVVWTRAL